MDSQRIDIHIHHGGNFDEGGGGGRVRYRWGKVDIWPDCYEDMLDVFSFRNFSKELGYNSLSNVWWLDPSKKFKDGLRELKEDCDLLEAVQVAKMHGSGLHIY